MCRLPKSKHGAVACLWPPRLQLCHAMALISPATAALRCAVDSGFVFGVRVAPRRGRPGPPKEKREQPLPVSAGGSLAMGARTCQRGKRTRPVISVSKLPIAVTKVSFNRSLPCIPQCTSRDASNHSAVESSTPRGLQRVLHFVSQNGGVISDPLIN